MNRDTPKVQPISAVRKPPGWGPTRSSLSTGCRGADPGALGSTEDAALELQSECGGNWRRGRWRQTFPMLLLKTNFLHLPRTTLSVSKFSMLFLKFCLHVSSTKIGLLSILESTGVLFPVFSFGPTLPQVAYLKLKFQY